MKVIQKIVLVICALVIASCSGSNSSDSNPAPTGDLTPTTNEEQSKLVVKLGGEEWSVGSILAISAMGNVTMYFTKKVDVSCMDMAQSPSLNDTIQILFPENVQSFENFDRDQMGKNGLTVNFIKNMMNPKSASLLSLTVERIDENSVAAKIQATTEDGDSISGHFDAKYCFKN